MSTVKTWGGYYSPQQTTFNPQTTANGIRLQGSSPRLQGSSPQLQVSSSAGQTLQPAVSPMNVSVPSGGGGTPTAGLTNTAVDPAKEAADAAAAEAARIAAENAAKAAALRGEITGLVNSVKDIFNARYGQVDASVRDQTGRLNDRFGKESKDITGQVETENNKLGVAHAAGGSFDSSYRGNNVDTVTKAGKGQIEDLGTELKEDIGAIGGWATKTKAGYDAEKGAMDTLLSRIAESTDPSELTSVRNSLDAKIAQLKGQAADNNILGQNVAALNAIAPTNLRAQKLKTTLSQIVAGNADAAQKSAIANTLINNAQLSPEDEEQLLTAFQSDLSTAEKQQQA